MTNPSESVNLRTLGLGLQFAMDGIDAKTAARRRVAYTRFKEAVDAAAHPAHAHSALAMDAQDVTDQEDALTHQVKHVLLMYRSRMLRAATPSTETKDDLRAEIERVRVKLRPLIYC